MLYSLYIKALEFLGNINIDDYILFNDVSSLFEKYDEDEVLLLKKGYSIRLKMIFIMLLLIIHVFVLIAFSLMNVILEVFFQFSKFQKYCVL